MKAILTLLPIAAAATLMSCSNKIDTRKAVVSARASDPISAGVHTEVNNYRSTLGISKLQRHAGLDALARKHSQYLRDNRGTFNLYGTNVSHIGSDGRSMVAVRRFNMSNTSENVAAMRGQSSASGNAKGLVIMWKNSSKHHDSIKSSAWTHTGIGSVTGEDGTVFCTQLFGSMTMSQMVSRERFNQF